MSDSEVYDRLRGVEMQISTHEAVCAERYAGILNTASRTEKSIESMNRILFGLGAVLISTLAGIIVDITFK
jgi:hypothetical protein